METLSGIIAQMAMLLALNNDPVLKTVPLKITTVPLKGISPGELLDVTELTQISTGTKLQGNGKC